ncbi:7466_t:CDS:1 [Cetraspora pellucida]|uniref:7466_t:CDS:1 n=1 Tax=Cetraspora pellucida TaxID=1433469 RepID=A0A9N9NLQ6_9GLOM|nr:7466_t:CDS:1 [Cetraspora pellucida]
MTSYDPKSFRAFFEPTKPVQLRLYATSKRHRPQITSITLLEYKNGHVTTEEQISHSPLSFSVNKSGKFRLFHYKSLWHMYIQVSTDSFKNKNLQRYVSPLGFEVEVDMNVSDGKCRLTTSKDINDQVTLTPPPIARSTSSFPFRDHQFIEWCVRKPPKWRRILDHTNDTVRSWCRRGFV